MTRHHLDIPYTTLLPTAHKEDSTYNENNYDEWNQGQ